MLFRHRRQQSDFSAELQAHLELEKDRLRAEGLSEDEAYHTARKNLGNLAAAEERFYESNRWLWLEQMLQDARHALRRLRDAPAFTIATVVTLAVGIGATTSIFTLAHAVLLKSLPVANPSQLYRLGNTPHCCVWAGYNQGAEFSMVSWELYRYFRENTRGFDHLRRPPRAQRRPGREFTGQIRLRQLLRDVWSGRLRRACVDRCR
jgi:hypothetical protein